MNVKGFLFPTITIYLFLILPRDHNKNLKVRVLLNKVNKNENFLLYFGNNNSLYETQYLKWN